MDSYVYNISSNRNVSKKAGFNEKPIHLNSLLMRASIILKYCMDEDKDWRKCQEHVKAFKARIDEQNKQKKA